MSDIDIKLTRPPPKPEELFQVAAIIAMLASGVSGMGVAGWFGEPWSLVIALLVAIAGAVIAGFVEKKTLRERVFASVSFAVGAVVVVVATSLYLDGRSQIMKAELIIPLGIGAIAFALTRLVIGKLVR